MEISIPDPWYAVANDLERTGGIALLLGATDTGKSTLAKFLITRLCQREMATGLVDADIGQAFLGPPTTIGFSLFTSPPDWETAVPEEIFFVGSTSPAGNLALHLTGTKQMVDRAVASGAKATIVDTTGLVLGPFGRFLKKRKIDLLSPRFIIAIQRSEELELILESYEGSPTIRIYRLSPSEHTCIRSWEERGAYRAKKFKHYFAGSKSFGLDMEGILLEGKVKDSDGSSIPLEQALGFEGLLLGLKDRKDRTLGLGLIEEYGKNRKVLRIRTPLKSLKRVRRIYLASLTLTPAFEDRGL